MKKLVLAMTLLFATAAQAKTINYDVFKSTKSVESTSSVSPKVFDFKLVDVVTSKTVTTKRCSTTGPVRDRVPGLCNEVTVTKAKVAQVSLGYRPYGTTDRRGEVNNGKYVYFVKFNISTDDLTYDALNTLKLSNKSARRALAKEMLSIEVNRDGRTHNITVLQK